MVICLHSSGKAIHSSILAWKIPSTEKPGGLLSMGLQRVGHNWGYTHTEYIINALRLFLYFFKIVLLCLGSFLAT